MDLWQPMYTGPRLAIYYQRHAVTARWWPALSGHRYAQRPQSVHYSPRPARNRSRPAQNSQSPALQRPAHNSSRPAHNSSRPAHNSSKPTQQPEPGMHDSLRPAHNSQRTARFRQLSRRAQDSTRRKQNRQNSLPRSSKYRSFITIKGKALQTPIHHYNRLPNLIWWFCRPFITNCRNNRYSGLIFLKQI